MFSFHANHDLSFTTFLHPKCPRADTGQVLFVRGGGCGRHQAISIHRSQVHTNTTRRLSTPLEINKREPCLRFGSRGPRANNWECHLSPRTLQINALTATQRQLPMNGCGVLLLSVLFSYRGWRAGRGSFLYQNSLRHIWMFYYREAQEVEE